MIDNIKIQRSSKIKDTRVLVAANINGEWRVVAELAHDIEVSLVPTNGHTITSYAEDFEFPYFLTVRHRREYLLVRKLRGHKKEYVVTGQSLLPDAAQVSLV